MKKAILEKVDIESTIWPSKQRKYKNEKNNYAHLMKVLAHNYTLNKTRIKLITHFIQIGLFY